MLADEMKKFSVPDVIHRILKFLLTYSRQDPESIEVNEMTTLVGVMRLHLMIPNLPIDPIVQKLQGEI